MNRGAGIRPVPTDLEINSCRCACQAMTGTAAIYNRMMIHLAATGEMFTHCSCNCISPLSTFLSRRIMSCTNLPFLQHTWLSSARQFLVLGLTDLMMAPFLISSGFMFTASINGATSISASPIGSSLLNVSLSNTSCMQQCASQDIYR